MSAPIPVNEPLLCGNERQYVLSCIESGWLSSEGMFVEQFERRFAEKVARRHGIAVCNGTAALETAVAALDLEPGSEIIVPTFTIISCVAAILRRGCVPVLVDCDPATWNMDPEFVEARITSKTKAIMVVHLYGLPADMAPLLGIARRYGLFVIEDASQMIGQTYDGSPCGSFGDISTFSFYANKVVTTGEGGMIVASDDRLARRCRDLRNLCFSSGRRFVHEELGYNFRMTNLQAALGLAQLERMEDAVYRKREMGRHYTRLLSGVPGLQLPVPSTGYADNIYWVYGIVLADSLPFDADAAMHALAERGIGTRPFFWPMHEQPVFLKAGLFSGEAYPVAERIARRGYYVPSGLALTGEQRERVCEALDEIIRGGAA